MDKPRALGRWPNAPLAYLVAEIKFQRVHNFESVAHELAARLTGEYPLEETAAENFIEVNNGIAQQSSEPIFDYKNFASTVGVRVTRGSIALHCTDYAGWSGGFRERLFGLLDSVADAVRPRVLLRSSIRCVDLFVPERNRAPDEVLVNSLRPWTTGEDSLGRIEQANIAARFKHEEFFSTVLVFSRAKGPTFLSPTLSAMSLKFSPIQSKAMSFHQSTGQAFAIMDIDVANEGARPFNLSELKQQYEEIHRLSSAGFKAATTVDAQRVWKAE